MPARIRAFKARKLGEGLSPNTVGSMQGVLSAALNQAVDDGLIASNPASRVKRAAKRGEPPMRALTNDEASRLVAAAQGTRDEALIVLALKTGMRQGELATLRWEDLDLSGPRPTVTVRRSADARTQPRVSTTKAGRGRRVGLHIRTPSGTSAHFADI